MIDLNRLRDEFETVKRLINKKDSAFDVDDLARLDKNVRLIRSEIEALRGERNVLAKDAAGGVTEEIRKKSILLGKELKTKEKELKRQEILFKQSWLSCPNIPVEEVPAGGSEKNEIIKIYGSKPKFFFAPQNHLELNEILGWFDFESGAIMSGAQFVVYRKDAVKLLYVLAHLMLKNNVQYGFDPVSTPYFVNEEAMINSGIFPKFVHEVYEIPEDGLYPIPTSEVSLANLYAKKILSAQELPIRHTAWTSCFRREAGGYGTQERGLIRIHQFDKVELYSICEPERSNEELELMVVCAENILRQLGLHYRVSLLAGQDMSFSSTKTFDLEVWLPGQERYYEVSSISNCSDFQARRAAIRYRKESETKPQIVHTLNASSLALPRLMVAILEQYQQKDGSIKLPLILQEALESMW